MAIILQANGYFSQSYKALKVRICSECALFAMGGRNRESASYCEISFGAHSVRENNSVISRKMLSCSSLI